MKTIDLKEIIDTVSNTGCKMQALESICLSVCIPLAFLPFI